MSALSSEVIFTLRCLQETFVILTLNITVENSPINRTLFLLKVLAKEKTRHDTHQKKRKKKRYRCQHLTLGTEMMISVVTVDPDCIKRL